MKHLFIIIFTLSSMTAMATIASDSTRFVQLQKAVSTLNMEDDHCEVPCGIYGDSLRVALIDEHIRTVEKATMQINKLSKDASPNYNQLVRWINNKEKHAEEIQQIVAQYFMHQRVKIPAINDGKARAKYQNQLMYLHHIQVYAMKAKQGTDLENIVNLKASLQAFSDVYFHKHDHDHGEHGHKH